MHAAPRGQEFGGRRWQPGRLPKARKQTLERGLEEKEAREEKKARSAEDREALKNVFFKGERYAKAEDLPWRKGSAGSPEAAPEDGEARRASLERVSESHFKQHEAEHWAGQPYATPEQMARARQARHEANVAHVEHAERYGNEEAHGASESGRERFAQHLVGLAEAKAKSTFTEAKPTQFAYPAQHGLLYEARPRMHQTPGEPFKPLKDFQWAPKGIAT